MERLETLSRQTSKAAGQLCTHTGVCSVRGFEKLKTIPSISISVGHFDRQLWATLFPSAAWPAQLCGNSLLPRQVAHHLSKCPGPPLGIFTRPDSGLEMTWPLFRTFSGYRFLHPWIFEWTYYHTISWLKLQFKMLFFCAAREIPWSCTVLRSSYTNQHLSCQSTQIQKWKQQHLFGTVA